ncbi:NucA/NucB deoxyribonuclease domain-containing protein [Amycolatopsis sp. NPDC051903]|uniref:NucA/NucB deoxyribonuclease domain-containing protein n=1 Tax=Amycolatopsis sp. NPDC051903 TaxID=3363936 RepID=UPI00379701D0
MLSLTGVGTVSASAAPVAGATPLARSCSTTTDGGKAATRCTQVFIKGGKRTKNTDAANSARSNARSMSTGKKPADVIPACAGGFYNPDRFTSCSVEEWTVESTETVDGVTTVVGTIPITFSGAVEFDDDGLGGGAPAWLFDESITIGQGTGTLTAGTGGTLSTGCGKDPAVCETTQGNENMPVELLSDTTVEFTWNQIDNGDATRLANTLDFLTGFLGVDVTLTENVFNPVDLNDSANNTLFGRCDSVNPNTSCVDHAYPYNAVAFDATVKPLIGPVADHVFNAEATLPTHWGNPNYPNSQLTRSTDPAVEANNRGVACANVPPSCDEYPMATTNQGAFYSAPGDWSAVTVPVSANNSQGGTMTNFNNYNRIVDGDEFWVLAVKADGSQSW